MKITKKPSIKRIIFLISLGIVLLPITFLVAMFIYHDTTLFKTPIAIQGLAQKGWYNTPVPTTYIQTTDAHIYVLFSNKNSNLDNCPPQDISCYEGKSISLEGLLTKSSYNIYTKDNVLVKAYGLEVTKAILQNN
ncbi:MAG: hypothetical protein M1607_01065 [Patescibacteria group bacterium]|nr:hypothetical protein [Patescibacteria group bacterium]